jgi:hypothetical protein
MERLLRIGWPGAQRTSQTAAARQLVEHHESRRALAKHSPMFGHDASSHTVQAMFGQGSLIALKVSLRDTRTRIHAGLASGALLPL